MIEKAEFPRQGESGVDESISFLGIGFMQIFPKAVVTGHCILICDFGYELVEVYL